MTVQQVPKGRTVRRARGRTHSTGRAGHAVTLCTGAGSDWPDWARAQLDRAAVLAAVTPAGDSVAAALYRNWFAPQVGAGRYPRRPSVEIFRAAHAGAGHTAADGAARADRPVAAVERHDVIGADGWWRTWGRSWTPPRSRPGSVRVLFTPDPAQLGDFVHRLTVALLGEPLPWTVAVATEARRIRRAGAAVLDLPGDGSATALLDAVLARVSPTLLAVAQPLCKPLAPGAALAQYPDNGMTFGEHRCHLVALGLRRAGTRDPLTSIAEVFAAHGIDPERPYRSR